MIWELANGEEKWPRLRQHTFVFVVSCPLGITSSQVPSEIKIDKMFLKTWIIDANCLVPLPDLIVDHHDNIYHHHRHICLNPHPHRGNVKDWVKDREQRVVGDHSGPVQALKHLFKSLHGHLRSSGGRVLMFPLQFGNRWIIVDRTRPALLTTFYPYQFLLPTRGVVPISVVNYAQAWGSVSSFWLAATSPLLDLTWVVEKTNTRHRSRAPFIRHHHDLNARQTVSCNIGRGAGLKNFQAFIHIPLHVQ